MNATFRPKLIVKNYMYDLKLGVVQTFEQFGIMKGMNTFWIIYPL